MAFLAIAEGAVAIGQKIFGGIKRRRTERKAKRAVRQAARDAKLAVAEMNILGTPGIIPDSGISQAAASFQNMIGNAGFVDQVRDREDIRLMQQDPEQKENRMVLIIGGAFLLLVLFGKKLFR